MKEEAYLTGAIILYLGSFILWYLRGKSRRQRNIILLINLCVVMLYTAVTAIAGGDKCGMDSWFCFKWYDYALLFFILHLMIFWCFMIIHLVIELISKHLNPGKNKQL